MEPFSMQLIVRNILGGRTGGVDGGGRGDGAVVLSLSLKP